jgi:hypothetical protein
LSTEVTALAEQGLNSIHSLPWHQIPGSAKKTLAWDSVELTLTL